MMVQQTFQQKKDGIHWMRYISVFDTQEQLDAS